MIECAACHTLNPDGEQTCLICHAQLTALPLQARCAAGHPMDPSWHRCPYCERLQTAPGAPPPTTRLDPAPQEASRATRLEATGRPAGGDLGVAIQTAARPTRLEEQPTADLRLAAMEPPPRLPAKPTRLEVPAVAAAPRRTVLSEPAAFTSLETAPPQALPTDASRVPAKPPGEARLLVAVLVAPTFVAGGAVFPVRAGKNTIGASPGSDICLAQDSKVSSDHAVLLYRGGSFTVADRMSSNGTWVNGREVPPNGVVAVQDRDRIVCGGVDLLLLTFAPPAVAESPH
jgi:hypothetical protein